MARRAKMDPKEKTVSLSLTIPQGIVDQVDAAAKARGITRSLQVTRILQAWLEDHQ